MFRYLLLVACLLVPGAAGHDLHDGQELPIDQEISKDREEQAEKLHDEAATFNGVDYSVEWLVDKLLNHKMQLAVGAFYVIVILAQAYFFVTRIFLSKKADFSTDYAAEEIAEVRLKASDPDFWIRCRIVGPSNEDKEKFEIEVLDVDRHAEAKQFEGKTVAVAASALRKREDAAATECTAEEKKGQ